MKIGFVCVRVHDRGTDWVYLPLIHVPLQKVTFSISSVFFSMCAESSYDSVHIVIFSCPLVIFSILYQHHTFSFTSAD